jgi:hypothetical protein
MSLKKRISGPFSIESVNETDTIIIKSQDFRIQGLTSANTVTIDGNLIITGDTTTVTSINTEVVDAFMTLNSGEGASATGITYLATEFDSAASAGIIVDRGSILTDVGLRFNEDLDRWEATDNGTGWYPLDASLAASFDVVTDTTPQLGGNLDVNGKTITSAANGDVLIAANGAGNIVLSTGTGLVKIDQDVALKEQVGDEAATTGYNKIYAKAPGDGGSGIYVSNDITTDELVARRKAIVFSIIF